MEVVGLFAVSQLVGGAGHNIAQVRTTTDDDATVLVVWVAVLSSGAERHSENIDQHTVILRLRDTQIGN